jgi:hypothetical protein
MIMSAETQPRDAAWGAVALATTIAALGVHIWAGWKDEHRLVLRVVGHRSVLAFAAWVLALVVAGVAVMATKGRSRQAIAAGLVSGIGIALLFLA